MKRCPECRRDYYDDTLLYCLEDGIALVQGSVPAPVGEADEPATAILSEPGAIATGFPASESPARLQINTTDQTAILARGAEAEPRESLGGLSEKHSFSANRATKPLAALVLAALLLVGGFFGYKYLTPAKQIESIAVMPFVNESGNADVEYLSDGMTETLIKSLSQVPNLAVKSRSTVFYYKGKETSPKKIGEELGVQAVLLGRVGGRGDDLKLSLELVNTQTQDVIWAEQYERKQSDLVSLQSEIAKDVSSKLQTKLSGAEVAKVTKTATANPEAYQAYLKGRFYWNRRTAENLQKAIEQFKIATDRDPNYALAYAGLADCYALLNEYAGTPTSETLPRAKAYAERAIAIDDQLAEPHASLGAIYRKSWRFAEAEKEFKRAIELNPNYATAYHWYSIVLLNLGRYDESLAMIQRAHELDPLSSIITITISWVLLSRNNHQASIENLLKLIELDPTFGHAYDNLGLAYLKIGRNAEAVAAFEKAAQLTDRYSFVLGNLGYIYAVTGRRTEAFAVIRELEEKDARKEANGVSLAAVYAGLGDKEKAFQWLEKDFQNRDGNLPDITVSIPLESIRDDPRFKDLLKRMNLPE
jgi:TolB-like protein/Flp pilus assembly protein TadD